MTPSQAPDPRPAAAASGTAPGHEVTVHDGRFSSAECTCGWRGAARRHRATARQEARDHVLLYADGSELSAGTAPAAGRTEHRAGADTGS